MLTCLCAPAPFIICWMFLRTSRRSCVVPVSYICLTWIMFSFQFLVVFCFEFVLYFVMLYTCFYYFFVVLNFVFQNEEFVLLFMSMAILLCLILIHVLFGRFFYLPCWLFTISLPSPRYSNPPLPLATKTERSVISLKVTQTWHISCIFIYSTFSTRFRVLFASK